MKDNIANSINIVSDFCGKRDIETLSQESLKEKYGIECADVMVLFGGSIICGGDVLASAIKKHVAKKYIIVGGAGLRKYVSEDVIIINYATYKAEVVVENNELKYSMDISGMWVMDRYVELLLGEIPRLSDNSDGYGPNGKNYIAHVDIPNEVQCAFEALMKNSGVNVRAANSLYASK